VPRNPAQNQRMRDDRRQQILSAAVRLFATRGLAATKISDIAAAVGMSQGLLYHYFPSKNAIFVEIIRHAFERMNTAARQLERSTLSPRHKLEMAATQTLRSLEESNDFAWFSTLISEASVSEAIPKEAKAILHKQAAVPYQVMERIIREGQQDGSVVDYPPDQLALVFWTTIKGLALHRAAHGPAFKSPDPRILTSIFFRKESS